MQSVRSFALLSIFALGVAFGQTAETAIVKRNVTLRPDPSTDNQSIMTLGRGQRVALISLQRTNGYLHVAVNKQKGWVWARNVDVEESSDEVENNSANPKDITNPTDTCASESVEALKRVGPAALYPDAMKTQGCAATLKVDDLTKTWTDNCPGGKESCTYSQAHRKVSNSERTVVYDEYQVPGNRRNIRNGEIDHFYPLCAGGSNSTNNLWYQPIDNQWNGRNFGFKEKDKLEAWICKQIKIHKLDPKEAFDRMTNDWVSFYIQEIAGDDEVQEQITDDEGDGGR